MDTSIMSSPLKIKNLDTVDFSIDQMCTLYFYENRIFRGVNDNYISQVKDMFECGLISELIDKKLFVNTWISDVEIEGYKLVLEHERIEYWNYPYEWSFSMLHNAANVVLDVNELAFKHGYEIFDSHAYNVVFVMNKPVYVDFGSFIKKDDRNKNSWAGFSNFYNSFYIPLFLYKKGYADVPNNIFLYNGFYNDKDLFKLRYPYASLFGKSISNLFYHATFSKRRLASARYSRVIDKYGRHKHFSKLIRFKKAFQNSYSTKYARKLIAKVNKSSFDSYWKDYHDDKDPKNDTRFLRIKEIVKKHMADATSAVELASNQGKFANFLINNTHLSTMISTDYDKNALDQNFKNNSSKDNFLTLVHDFVRPNQRQNTSSFAHRIQGDVVIALAVTHHLILTQDVSLDHIFDTLENLSKKYIIVEFMPLGLYFGDMNNIPKTPDYYSLDWFDGAFRERFDYILDEELAINRHVFVGKCK